jgi:hypothetical protein
VTEFANAQFACGSIESGYLGAFDFPAVGVEQRNIPAGPEFMRIPAPRRIDNARGRRAFAHPAFRGAATQKLMPADCAIRQRCKAVRESAAYIDPELPTVRSHRNILERVSRNCSGFFVV